MGEGMKEAEWKQNVQVSKNNKKEHEYKKGVKGHCSQTPWMWWLRPLILALGRQEELGSL